MGWTRIEEGVGRWANVFALLPGSYCAYAEWDRRHGGMGMHVSNPALLFSLCLFLLCISVAAIANWLRSRKTTNVSDDEGVTNVVMKNCVFERQMIALGCDVDGLFTPLQIEAFRLSKEIRELIARIPPSPKFEGMSKSQVLDAMFSKDTPYAIELNKVQAEYASRLAHRVKKAVLDMRTEGCLFDPWVDYWSHDNWPGNPPNEAILKPLGDTLIAMAHKLNGVNLTVKTYPRNK